MAKQLYQGTITFDASAQSIVLDGNVQRDRLLLITNVTDNQLIFNFADPDARLTSHSYSSTTDKTTIELNYDTTSMSDDDVLQVFFEGNGQLIEPVDDLLDPVGKIRTSQPENLIDTDFEYGLQSQKWETLEQVKNIPTFFARDGDVEIPLTKIETTNGSDVIKVTTTIDHGFSVGTTFILQGTSNATVNGGFVVSARLSATEFQFKSKADQTATRNIKDEYTRLFAGSIYQGTEFGNDGVSKITTDGKTDSTLTVNTKFPVNFLKGTEFYLNNSLSTVGLEFDASQINGDDTTTTTFTIDPTSDTNGTTTGHWKSAAPKHDAYIPLGKCFYFDAADITGIASNIITFDSAHGLETGTYFYSAGYGNREFATGVRNGFYYFVHVHSASTISLHSTVTDANNDNTRITLGTLVTDGSQNAGVARHYFHKAWLYDVSANDNQIDATNINTVLTGDRFTDLFSLVDGQSDVYAMGPGFDASDNDITHEGIGYLYDVQILGTSGNDIIGDFLGKRYSQGIAFRVVRRDFGQNGRIYKENHGLPDGAGVTVSYTPVGDYTVNTEAEFAQWFPHRLGAEWNAPGTGAGSDGGFVESATGQGGHIRLGKDPYYVSSDSKDELFKIHLNDENHNVRHLMSREFLVEGSSDDWGYGDNETTFTINFKAIKGNGSNGGDTATQNLTVGLRDLNDNNVTFSQPYGLSSSWADYSFTGTVTLNRPFQIVFMMSGADTLTDEDHIGIDAVEFDVDTNFWIGNTDNWHMKVDRIDNNEFRLLNPAGGSYFYAGYPQANFTVTHTKDLSNTDTITKTGHGLADQTSITYDRNGNTAISGLTDGSTFFAVNGTTNTFQVATSETGTSGASLELFQYQSTDADFGIGRGNNTDSTFYIGTYANAVSEGYSTGTRVQYTAPTGNPIPGLTDQGFYFIRLIQDGSGGWVRFYRSLANANSDTNHIKINDSDADRKGTIQKTTVVDVEAGTGTHKFSTTQKGAADGLYQISKVTDTQSFQLKTNKEITNRKIALDKTSIDQQNNAVYLVDHGLVNGTPLTLTTTGTAPGGLNDGSTTQFFAIRVNDDYFRVAALEEDVNNNVYVTLDTLGTGTNTFTTSSISGEIQASGTVSITDGSKVVTGLGTNFNSQFNAGEKFIAFVGESTTDLNVTAVNQSTNVFTDAGHGLSDGDLLRSLRDTADFDKGDLVYANAIDTDTFTIHSLRSDGVSGLNPIDITESNTGAVFTRVTAIGSTVEADIDFVNSPKRITLKSAVSTTGSGLKYALKTSVLVRSNGFALHRPFDGGVDLVPAQNPDGHMIRQTRKYFRYQSGKGIQISNGINFSPSVPIMEMRLETTDSSQHAIIKTRYPHRMTTGTSIKVEDATVTSGTNYWNGTFIVQRIVNQYEFEVDLTGTPDDTFAMGSPSFVVNSWNGAVIRSGLMDDQNGLFFEYDGQKLYCVHRSSTYQISGNCSVAKGSAQLSGVDTKFLSQVAVDDKLVIRGQTYRITRIDSNSSLFFMPSYRGQDADAVVVSKVIDKKVAQENWSVDPCDGTGPTGYVLNIHKMQMAYVDYSWYGAGKVRFGFKDQNGRVKYVHEFINNNKQTEAYMRSGNLPVRYELENIGNPSYVPSLAHWGTSVIMDGRFDQDDSYVFAASARNIAISGDASLTVSAKVEHDDKYRIKDPANNYPEAGFALTLAASDPINNAIFEGATITGANLATGTKVTNPEGALGALRLPVQPYFPSVISATGGDFTGTDIENESVRSLLLIDKEPTGTAVSDSNYTVTLASAATSKTVDQPLISIRLAPSVDTGIPGGLGERELINRMQLIMESVQVLTTHAVEVNLVLNGLLDRNDWKQVNRPSLAQLVYHEAGDQIIGGTKVFSFKADGTEGTADRILKGTLVGLDHLDAIGNSILGGDAVFPDGPDVLSIVVRVIEDPSTVSNSNPAIISGKISWNESQS